VIRCWEPRDAAALKEAVDASLGHLQPWMPWAAHEPQTLDEKVELLRSFRGQFDKGENFVYAIFARDESQVVGGTGLHPRADDDSSLEIGYWIRESEIGRGLAREATAVLTRIAFDVCRVERVDIRVEPSNERSLAVPRKLGFVEEATLRSRLPPKEPGGPLRDVVMFSILPGELASSPCVRFEYAALDAAGRRL